MDFLMHYFGAYGLIRDCPHYFGAIRLGISGALRPFKLIEALPKHLHYSCFRTGAHHDET